MSIGIASAKPNFVLRLDAMHGSAAGLLPELFKRHAIDCEEIRGTRDPRFGGAHPEPIEPHIAPLQKAVTQPGNMTQVSQRMETATGSARWIERARSSIRTRFSRFWYGISAGTRNLPGEIAKTFSVTKLIDKLAAKFGRKLHELPIGFKYMCELMLEQNILIGGEESGGIGTSLYLPERDATVSALFLAELMAWHGKSLGEMLTNLYREFGDFHYRRVDLDVTARQKDQAIAWFSDNSTSKIGKWRVANRESIDGVKLYLSDSGGEIGWVLVRASGTENLLRVYSETSLLETTESVLDAVKSHVHSF